MNDNNLLITPLKGEHLSAVTEIGSASGLSIWTINDYQDELSRNDSLSYICLDGNNRTSGRKQSSQNILGFIVARLIRSEIYLVANTVDVDAQTTNLLEIKSERRNQTQQKNECEVFNLAVRTEYRRMGIGQKLFEKILEECTRNKVGAIWLEVRKSNENAVGFYRKNGFQVAYTRKNYYRNPLDDALVLKVDLS